MTNMISELLEAAVRQAVPVVREVSDEELDRPTPCSDYRVRELLGHLMQVVVNFQELAAKRPVDWTAGGDWLAGDWRARFEAETGRLVEAWAAPGADQGVTGGMGMPAETVGGMVLLDLTVHAWDLARATGKSFGPDEAAVRRLAPLFAELAPMGREMGMFGEPVAVGEEGAEFERLLAATGRDPRW